MRMEEFEQPRVFMKKIKGDINRAIKVKQENATRVSESEAMKNAKALFDEGNKLDPEKKAKTEPTSVFKEKRIGETVIRRRKAA